MNSRSFSPRFFVFLGQLVLTRGHRSKEGNVYLRGETPPHLLDAAKASKTEAALRKLVNVNAAPAGHFPTSPTFVVDIPSRDPVHTI